MGTYSGPATRLLTPPGEPILTAKFRVPAVPRWKVDRHRLLDRISIGTGGPLTVVTAPAGSGKTMLAASWVDSTRAEGPVVWISLDTQDNQSDVLWTYILAGLAQAGIPAAPEDVTSCLHDTEKSPLVRLAAILADQPRRVVLVLDDAHTLTSQEVCDGLDFLLRRAAPRLSLVVLGRRAPGLPLHRYRMAGSIVELGLDDLAFTVPEAAALLTAHGVEMPAAEVSTLVGRAKGWAASLRLAARSAQRHTGAGQPADAGCQDEIGDYFIAEVFNAQPSAIQDFLLQTSVVDRIWPGLAAELTGHRDAPQTLAELARTSSFLAPDAAGGRSYEYSPLVRDVLRSRLQREAPNKVARLHRRAARWLAGTGRLTEAVTHAAAGDDWRTAATLLVSNLAIGRLIVGPQAGHLTGVLNGMPGDLENGAVALVRAALALRAGDTDLCGKHLARATELVVDPPANSAPARLCAAVTDLVRAAARGESTGALAAVATAEAEMSDLHGRGCPVPAELRALVLLVKGRSLLWLGDVEPAARTLGAGLSQTEAPDAEHLRTACLGHLALAEALQGRLKRAVDFARRAADEADVVPGTTAGEPAVLSVGTSSSIAYLALAWAHVEWYDVKAASGFAERAEAAEHTHDDPVLAGLSALVRARLHRARGDNAGAVTAVKRAGTALPEAIPTWLLERLAAMEATIRADGGSPELADAALPHSAAPHAVLASARIRLIRGAFADAAEAVQSLATRSDLSLDQRVEALLLSAAGDLATGRTESTRYALSHALRLAETEKLRRPVIEATPQLRRFLRQDQDLVARHGWLGSTVVGPADPRLRRSSVAPSSVPSLGPVLEPLTAKETEVLGHLAALLSTEEIARKMFVSVNTVKTHIRSVLRKLAASRRNEAIRRARDLGLV